MASRTVEKICHSQALAELRGMLKSRGEALRSGGRGVGIHFNHIPLQIRVQGLGFKSSGANFSLLGLINILIGTIGVEYLARASPDTPCMQQFR